MHAFVYIPTNSFEFPFICVFTTHGYLLTYLLITLWLGEMPSSFDFDLHFSDDLWHWTLLHELAGYLCFRFLRNIQSDHWPTSETELLGFCCWGGFLCVWLREDILKIKSTKSSLNTITFKNTSSKINNFHSHYCDITFDAGHFSYVRIQVLFYI